MHEAGAVNTLTFAKFPLGNEGRGDRYHYDPEGQLDRAWYRARYPDLEEPDDPKRGDTFQYDELGNRMGSNQVASRGATTFTRRNNGLNQYLSWTPSAIYHDDNFPWPSPTPATTWAKGVTMTEGWVSASFNALNQPMAIWSPAYPNGASAQYMWFGFDPLGRCVKRWVGPQVGGHAPPLSTNPAIYYYHDGWSLVQEGSSGNNAARLYVHGGRVDEIVASQGGGEWRYHHYDARGHCIMLTDPNGVLREQYDYDAFGLPYFYNVSGAKLGASAQWGNRFLFTGREWLQDLRIYDFRNRQYQPELGRFLQPDPKQFEAGDYNLYRYCHNDPINHSDPLGLTIDYDYPDAGEAAAARVLITRLLGMGGEIAARVQQLVDSKNRIVFIPIQKNVQGWQKYGLPPRENGDKTNRTTPNDENRSRGGRPGTGSKIELDPNNWKDPEGRQRDPVEAAGHEVDHAAASDKGQRLRTKDDEENRARAFQKQIREKLEKK